jgi:hypothetical protein
MRLALTLALFVPTFVAAVAIVRSLRRVPLGLAAPLALALVVCWEGIALPALSFAHGVRPDALVGVHLLPAGVAALALLRSPSRLRSSSSAAWRAIRHAVAFAFPPGVAFLVAPLAAAVAISAAEYAPNGWDSMTYHLARVAHWVFHRSVLYYPTFIHKQSVFPPGAEYLVLVPQVLSGSDRLANGVQLLCWGLAVLAAPALARLFGAPRRSAPFAALLVATLPMAVLQASGTQNDLVAAVMALALVASILPLLHVRGRRFRPADGLLLGIAAAAAWLVKPTALLVAAPFGLWGAWTTARSLRRSRPRRGAAVLAALAAVLPVVAVVGMEAIRRRPFGLSTDFAGKDLYLYPLVGEWADRLVNPIRAIGAHLALVTEPFLGAPCGAGVGCGFAPLRAHAALVVLTAGWLLARWRRATPRAAGAVLALLAGWVLLNAFFRSNAWISRLHTPAFVLGAAALGASPIAVDRLGGRLARAGVAVAVVALGLAAALRNELRPPRLVPPDAASSYYAALPALRPSHDRALHALEASGCRRLGVYFPGAADADFGEAWDYPLTWRARLEGIKVLTVVAPSDWPCLVYSTGQPPPFAPGRPPWIRLEPRIYVRSPSR